MLEKSTEFRGFEFTYERLLASAERIADCLNVPEEMRASTLHLLNHLKDHDEQVAQESLQGLHLALVVADSIEQFYETKVNKPAVWSAYILHDIGKLTINKELLQKSHDGKEWTEDDAVEMSKHAKAGYHIANDYGLPQTVVRAIAESHGKQPVRAYGMCEELGEDELHVRNCIAIADFADAMLYRTNTRNCSMSDEERRAAVGEDINFVFSDYQNDSAGLAALVERKLFLNLRLLA